MRSVWFIHLVYCSGVIFISLTLNPFHETGPSVWIFPYLVLKYGSHLSRGPKFGH